MTSPNLPEGTHYEVTVKLVGGAEQKIARLSGQQLSRLLEASANMTGVYVMTAGDDVLALPGRNIASVIARAVTR
ncbi:hypothetical protein AB0M47_38875 [Hamadaea sp. NPDC051192]|uniref:hypothetical protein n=1 Tax=Hamadaea sp. NPDC051192 TaxID=3154940 RepID=UPI003420025C